LRQEKHVSREIPAMFDLFSLGEKERSSFELLALGVLARLATLAVHRDVADGQSPG
jgi:hypothetical protein